MLIGCSSSADLIVQDVFSKNSASMRHLIKVASSFMMDGLSLMRVAKRKTSLKIDEKNYHMIAQIYAPINKKRCIFSSLTTYLTIY